MTRLHDLYNEQGQSPWLDNLRRDWLISGELDRWVERGIRGLTSNPTIFERAIGSSTDYDDQLAQLASDGVSVEDCYWELVLADICSAVDKLSVVHSESHGSDGYVSVEVAPNLAYDANATLVAARNLYSRVAAPNLYVKIPGTVEGIAAIREATAAGISVNVTLLFSIHRYAEIIDAYMDGLEQVQSADLSHISSVASFFISRVDTAVDTELEAIGTDEALELRGKVAVAQARAAYDLALARFDGPRWKTLKARGAQMQRPLWASTSTKNPSYPATKYVDELIGPDSVNTIPDDTLRAFIDHGTVSRTIDTDTEEANHILASTTAVGVDLDAIANKLEADGVASFVKSFDSLMTTLAERVRTSRSEP